MTDENGAPVYKVLGVGEGETEITLTTAANKADGTPAKYTYTLKVNAGIDKTDLKDAIQKTDGVVESIYTADSYAAYSEAWEYALEIDGKPDATRAEVEKATADLLNAYDALTVQPVDDSLKLKEAVVVDGDALYSDSNVYSNMFDDDLSTFWESPYGREDVQLPQKVILTLADNYLLEQLSFTSHTIHNGGVTQYTISVRTENGDWIEVTSGTVDADAYRQGQNVRIDARFAPTEAKYVKFTAVQSVGRISEEDNVYARIAEMDLYGTTRADKTSLNNLISTVDNLDQSKYTESSWAALSEPLAKAKAVFADNSATTAEVKDAYDALYAVYNDLEEITTPDPDPGESVRDELAQVISEMSGIKNNNYTADSWKRFEDAYQAALDMQENLSAPDEEVRAVIEELKAAYTELDKDWKAELEDVLAEMRGVANDNYTDVSWGVFQSQIQAAQDMLDAGDASDSELQAMITALQRARGDLVKKDDGTTKPGGGDGNGSGGAQTGDGKGDGGEAVQTGDHTSVTGLLAAVLISGGAVVVLARRKKER